MTRDQIIDLRRDILRRFNADQDDSRPMDNRVYNPAEVARTVDHASLLRRTLLLLEELA